MFLCNVIILIFANLAFSSACISQTSCRCVISNDKVIDISSVGSPEYPRFYQVSFNNNCNNSITELYSYSPCFQFDSSDKHTVVESDHVPCVGAAACIRTPGGSDGHFPEEHAIALQSTAKFMSVQGIYSIHYSVPKPEKTLIVNLICKEDDKKNVLEIHNCSDSLIVFNLTSKCACPNGCPSSIPPDSSPGGLSVGSKLLISFFTILLAYFVVGVLWNYCNGSQGVELIPNLEFWNDLPTLIMEGVVFTCSCCSTRSSYGEV